MPFIDCCNWTAPVIPTIACPFNEGQILRLGFQQKQATPSFTTAADLIDVAEWTTLLAVGAGAARIYLTPTSQDGKTGLYDFKIAAGAAIIQGGGDDTTLDGQEATIGYESSRWTLTGYDLPPAVILALKNLLRCGKSLTMYMINSNNQIIARTNGTSYEGFVITNMQVPDKNVNGSRERTTILLSGYIEKDYDTVEYISPATTFALSITN